MMRKSARGQRNYVCQRGSVLVSLSDDSEVDFHRYRKFDCLRWAQYLSFRRQKNLKFSQRHRFLPPLPTNHTKVRYASSQPRVTNSTVVIFTYWDDVTNLVIIQPQQNQIQYDYVATIPIQHFQPQPLLSIAHEHEIRIGVADNVVGLPSRLCCLLPQLGDCPCGGQKGTDSRCPATQCAKPISQASTTSIGAPARYGFGRKQDKCEQADEDACCERQHYLTEFSPTPHSPVNSMAGVQL